MDSRFKCRTLNNILPRWCFSKNILIVAMLLLVMDIILIILYKTDTLFTFFLTYATLMGINKLTIKAPKIFLSFIYALVVGMALMMVFSNSVNIPKFLGMTDALNGGTDDAFFFIQSMLGTDNEAAAKLPTIRYDAYLPERMTVYSRILHYWGGILSPIVKVYPVDLLFLNIIFICLYNLECILFCSKVTEEKRCVATIIPFLLFCPFMFSNGLVLVRDIIVAWCFVAACNCILTWDIKFLILPIICMVALRPATIAEFAIMAWFMLLITDNFGMEEKNKRHLTFWILGLAAGFLVAFNNIPRIMMYISQVSDGIRISAKSLLADDSLLLRMYDYPILVRVPLMAFYFFISPIFSVKAFFNNDVFVIREGVFGLFGLMNLVLLPRFINGFMYSFRLKKGKNMKYIAVLFIIMMVFISQLSTVIRHKTGFVFLYYTVASYGKYYKTKNSILIGNACCIVLTIYYILKTFISLL